MDDKKIPEQPVTLQADETHEATEKGEANHEDNA